MCIRDRSGAVGAFFSFTSTKLPRQTNTFDEHPSISPQAGSYWAVRAIVGRPGDRAPDSCAREHWSGPSSYALRSASTPVAQSRHRDARAERMESSTTVPWCMTTTSAQAERMESRSGMLRRGGRAHRLLGVVGDQRVDPPRVGIVVQQQRLHEQRAGQGDECAQCSEAPPPQQQGDE